MLLKIKCKKSNQRYLSPFFKHGLLQFLQRKHCVITVDDDSLFFRTAQSIKINSILLPLGFDVLDFSNLANELKLTELGGGGFFCLSADVDLFVKKRFGIVTL